MTVMTPSVVVEVLGSFGDGQDYIKESIFPLINILNPRKYSPKRIDQIAQIYTEYNLLDVHFGGMKSNEIKGHKYFKITEKGGKALDFYRDQIRRSLEHDEDQLSKRGITS